MTEWAISQKATVFTWLSVIPTSPAQSATAHWSLPSKTAIASGPHSEIHSVQIKGGVWPRLKPVNIRDSFSFTWPTTALSGFMVKKLNTEILIGQDLTLYQTHRPPLCYNHDSKRTDKWPPCCVCQFNPPSPRRLLCAEIKSRNETLVMYLQQCLHTHAKEMETEQVPRDKSIPHLIQHRPVRSAPELLP